jgi:hypothetical protein
MREDPRHRSDDRDFRGVAKTHNTQRRGADGTITTKDRGEAEDARTTKGGEGDTNTRTNTYYTIVAPNGTAWYKQGGK